MAEYLLPDVGEGLTEAEIVSWKVKVGDVVAINDVVVEIETAKSLVELPSPYAGTVLALLVPEGQTVPVGTPIIAIGEPAPPGEPTPAAAPAADTAADTEVIDTNIPPEGNPTLVGYGPREVTAQRRARKAVPSPGVASTRDAIDDAFGPGRLHSHDVVESDEPAVPVVPLEPVPPAAVRVLAKPPVRRLARDLGVDLAGVRPTGPGGTVSRADVEAAAGGTSSAGAPAASYAAPVERERREPIKGVRKMMAEAMVSSAFTAPHVTEWVTVDVTRTMDLVERLKLQPEFAEVKVSPLLVLARAVILAMRHTPEINSSWDEAAQEIVFKGYVNLGIAAATPRGLVVPNVKEAQDLSLVDLGRALNQLAATAREGRTQPAEMSGGTFTITNVGVFGVDSGTPIINPGESAILAFGAVKKMPWVVSTDTGDAIAIRQVTTLALAFDHRHIDGASGSRFLSDVAGLLGDPATALSF